MLVPRFIGGGKPGDNRLKLEDILVKFPVDNEPCEVTDYRKAQPSGMNWTKFVIAAEQEKKTDAFHFKLLSSASKTVLQYWMVDEKD